MNALMRLEVSVASQKFSGALRVPAAERPFLNF